MNSKIENRFFANYILMFFISTLIAFFAFMLLNFANDVISKNLIKNNYTAESLMMDDYNEIDTSLVINNGGGIQVINTKYEIVLSKGINNFGKDKLSVAEFTEFLTMSRSKAIQYSYSIEYNDKGQFWLIVTFPTSIRVDFAIVHNKDYPSVDTKGVLSVFILVIIFYLFLLALSTIVYSKLTSTSIINPLKKLCYSARLLKDGDYSSRVNLNLKNEFGELEYIFNEMAEQIENEISLRKRSEENRKRLMLDISHDLKNPLASIMGYSELCIKNKTLSVEEQIKYIQIIYENSLRANILITNLFEYSKMESPDYTINKTRLDICEYLKTEIASFIPYLDEAGFDYEFEIPEKEIFLMIDKEQMYRVLQNLITNTVKYNQKNIKLVILLREQEDEVIITFKDNGIGIREEIANNIFQPFVRVDNARNSETGGTGLGLSIVQKIIECHGGTIKLKTDEGFGCEFIITIPKKVE